MKLKKYVRDCFQLKTFTLSLQNIHNPTVIQLSPPKKVYKNKKRNVDFHFRKSTFIYMQICMQIYMKFLKKILLSSLNFVDLQ